MRIRVSALGVLLLTLQWLAPSVTLSAKKHPPVTSEISLGPPEKSAHGFVLVVHGLNLKPSRMVPLAREICNDRTNLHCRILSLPGHEDPAAAPVEAQETANHWKTALAREVTKMRQLAPERPLHFLGYSLGALLGVWASSQTGLGPSVFQKMALLAPPIETHFFTRIASWIPGPGHWTIPSLNHRDYRARNGTSLAAYRALRAIQVEVQRLDPLARYRGKLFIAVNPADELVDAGKLMRRAEHSNWPVHPPETLRCVLPLQPSISPAYEHLWIDEPSMGKTAWDDLRSRLQVFFSED
jgi:alpha-beta hydrolase superfamily lysophospholipase